MSELAEFIGSLHRDKEKMKRDISSGIADGDAIYNPLTKFSVDQLNIVVSTRDTSTDELWNRETWNGSVWNDGTYDNSMVKITERYYSWSKTTDFSKGTKSDNMDISKGDLR